MKTLPLKNLELTKELRYQIQMCRTQEELDRIVRRNKSSIHEHSYLSFIVENTRRVIRHIETIKYHCQTHLQN